MLQHMQSSFQRKAGSGHACAGCIHCRKLRKPLRKAGKCLRHTGCCASWLEVRIRTSPRIPGQVGCIRPSSRVFFHQTFVKAVIACFKAFPAGFDAFLVYRFHEIHSFFLRFPFVVPCFKIGKTCEKNCCTSCTAVLVIRRDLDGSGQGFLSSSYNRNLPLHRAFRSNR